MKILGWFNKRPRVTIPIDAALPISADADFEWLAKNDIITGYLYVRKSDGCVFGEVCLLEGRWRARLTSDKESTLWRDSHCAGRYLESSLPWNEDSQTSANEVSELEKLWRESK